MRNEKAEKDRQQDRDRLPHTAQIQDQQHGDEREFRRELEHHRPLGQQAEQRIDPTCNRNGDRQNVIDDQPGTRNEARARTDQAGRDTIATAAGREQLDHLVVGERNDEYRRGRGDRHEQAEVGVCAQSTERLLGTIRRRRQTVGPEADPGEKGDQRDVLAGPLA
jgi:hypothetical protein